MLRDLRFGGVLKAIDDGVEYDDEEDEENARQQPHVHQFEVGRFGELARCLREEVNG